MASRLSNVVRRERTRAELRLLRSAIEAWLTRRRLADRDAAGAYVGRHKTQLDTIEHVLGAAASQLADDADHLDTSLPEGEFYEKCRTLDIATVWLQRMWEFYRQKFDQRDDDRVGAVLRAADEVVWSCCHGVMERARKIDPSIDHGAVPLPFIAPEFSPAAVESNQPLVGALQLSVDLPGWDDELKKLVSSLPLLSLPPWCVDSPWWLVYVAHEIGHHVQGKLGLGGYYRDGVQKAAAAVSGGSADRWHGWADEIFADVFSVLSIGRWAAWSVAEVERSTAPRMRAPTRRYPAPATRLLLLERTARALALNAADVLTDVDVAALEAEQEHVTAEAVVGFALGALPNGTTLGGLVGLGKEPAQLAAQFEEKGAFWRAQLRSAVPPAPVRDLITPRHVIAGAVGAWRDVSRVEDEAKRAANTAALAKATIATLQVSGPAGARGDRQPEAPRLGKILAQRLSEAGARAQA